MTGGHFEALGFSSQEFGSQIKVQICSETFVFVGWLPESCKVAHPGAHTNNPTHYHEPLSSEKQIFKALSLSI